MPKSPWIGIDLDGTLAHFEVWKDVHTIGEPVPRMLRIIKWFLHNGFHVKIFTARASQGEAAILAIRDWLQKAGLPPDLEITDRKDYYMIECWDDLAISVEPNTGKRLGGASVMDM